MCRDRDVRSWRRWRAVSRGRGVPPRACVATRRVPRVPCVPATQRTTADILIRAAPTLDFAYAFRKLIWHIGRVRRLGGRLERARWDRESVTRMPMDGAGDALRSVPFASHWRRVWNCLRIWIESSRPFAYGHLRCAPIRDSRGKREIEGGRAIPDRHSTGHNPVGVDAFRSAGDC